MSLKIESFGITDVGLVRERNEDAWGELPEYNFFVLADGMGGHQAGDVASGLAVDTLCRTVENAVKDHSFPKDHFEAKEFLARSIEYVNREIFRKGQRNRSFRGMGTTICCLFFFPQTLIYAHVGDSRIYRLRNHVFVQMTQDHSLVSEMSPVDIALSEREGGKYRHVITKAVGTEPSVIPAVALSQLEAGDIYLMCSDGLTDLIDEKEISNILSSYKEVKIGAEALIEAAKKKGAHDNVTVVLAKIVHG